MSPAGLRGDSEAGRSAQAADRLERGRRFYEERAWRDAYDELAQADEVAPLGAADVELLATCEYMLGREDEWMRSLERAHHLHVDAGEIQRAVRCAFFIGANLALRGEMGGATGWLGRAQRLLDRDGRDCVERGYLLVIEMLQQLASGDYGAATDTAAVIAEIGQRFEDADLFALAVQDQGYLLIKDGQVKEGLGLLDEAMVAVTNGELSPIPTGWVYCGVISACQEVFEVRRAAEWTAALTRWCDRQPDMVAFTGRCLVHRAEVMQLQGAWADALEEARRAGRRFVETMNPIAGLAFYREGELLRLRGHTGRRAGADGSRSRGWPNSASREADATPPRRRSAEPPARLPTPSGAPACSPRVSRLCSPSGIWRKPGTPAVSSTRLPRATRARCWPRWPSMRTVRSTWPGVTRMPPSLRYAERCSGGTTLLLPTKRRGRESSLRRHVAHSAMGTRPT
jgi:tetratricopeptide (TPR) repeat protein